MRRYLLLALLLSLPLSQALASLDPVVDYLKTTPATVQGSINFDTKADVYQGSYGFIGIGVKVEPRENIKFYFNENFLNIYSEKAIVLTIAGIPVKINNISYKQGSGGFSVQTDSPLGIAEGTLNKKVEEVLNRLYKPKLERAFGELKSIRSKQNLADVEAVTKTIANIFSGADGPTGLPNFQGSMELIFNPPANKILRLGEMRVDLKARDRLSTGFYFKRAGNRTQVDGIFVNSTKGVSISGKTNYPELASINIREVKLTMDGIRSRYDIGAEDALAGLILSLKVIEAAASGSAPHCNLESPKLASIRQELDNRFQNELAILVRQHREKLLAAGISPQLLATLD